MISSVSPQSVPYSDPASPGYENRGMAASDDPSYRDRPAELKLPQFVMTSRDVQTLSEKIRFVRLKELIQDQPTHTPESSSSQKICAQDEYLMICDFPHQFSQASADAYTAHLIPFPAAIILPRVKVLSFNENQKGALRNLTPGEKVCINSFAILHDKQSADHASLVGEHLIAYGRKSLIQKINSIKVLDEIFSFFENRFWTPTNLQETNFSKFGGGLKRAAAAPTAVAGAKFIVRVPSDVVANVSEEDWKRRGVVSFEPTNNGTMTALKFSRMEIRDAACDSFILSLEIFGNREIGLSRLYNSVAIVENLKSEKDLHDFPEINRFYPPRSIRPPSR